VAAAIPEIEKGTGLKFKRPPVLQERSKDEVRQFLEREFREKLSDREIAGTQSAYRRFGLIPDTLDLRKFLVDFYTEQVAGYYDPKTRVLYLVKGAPPEQSNLIIQHELVHALQDQYTNLDSIQSQKGDNDAQMAASAVFEGHATIQQLQAMLGTGTDAGELFPGAWERLRDAIRQNSSSMPQFAAAPLIIQEAAIFPYLSGAEFIRRFDRLRHGQVPFGKNMPTSTEQILHEEAYFGPKRDEPTHITLPVPADDYQDDLGEFETRIFFYQHLQDQNEAVRAAAGWDGDRYVVLKSSRGDGLAWLTVWDSAVDAAEFTSAMEQVIAKRFGAPTAHQGSPGRKVYAAAGRTLVLQGREIQGRPAVLYLDVPVGASTNVLDLGRVQLEE
jgi:hypothetical protein